MESLFPTRRKIPPTGLCLARVNWGQHGMEPSWAWWGQRFSGGRTEGFQGPRPTTGQFRLSERPRAARGLRFLRRRLWLCSVPAPPPGRKGSGAPSSGQREDEKWAEPGSRTSGAGLPGVPTGMSEHLFQAGGSDATGSLLPWMAGFRKGRGSRALELEVHAGHENRSGGGPAQGGAAQ